MSWANTSFPGSMRRPPSSGMVSQTRILTTQGDIVRAHFAIQPNLGNDVMSNPESVSRTVVLGYLSSDLAADVVAGSRKGRRYQATISEITGGTRAKPTLGVNLLVVHEYLGKPTEIDAPDEPPNPEKKGLGCLPIAKLGCLVIVGLFVAAMVMRAIVGPTSQPPRQARIQPATSEETQNK